MAYSARTVPPNFHQAAVADFDTAVRTCFEQFTTLVPDNEQWEQACLNTQTGGLGLRSLSQHCSAAFLASRASCTKLCRELDAAHTFHSPQQAAPSPESQATNTYNSSVGESARLPHEPTAPLHQHSLSAAIDAHTFTRLTDQSTTTAARRAHLQLLSAHGAGLWLGVTPCKTAGLSVEPPLYVVMLQRWLRMQICPSDVFCPCCDGILDSYADHACVCCGGGDRTKRQGVDV